jgi:hypothetical protein
MRNTLSEPRICVLSTVFFHLMEIIWLEGKVSSELHHAKFFAKE